MVESLLDRDPCPDRILDDAGVAFAMGAVGGSAYHFLKGLRNSPCGARIPFSMEAVLMNAPHVAGSFAAWASLYSVCDCTMVYARQKEDPYNSILAGAVTSGILHVRQGFRSVARHSLISAALFACINGVGLMANRHYGPNPGPMPVDDSFIPHLETSSGVGKKVNEGATNGSSNIETLQTSDEPSTPIPSFEYK